MSPRPYLVLMILSITAYWTFVFVLYSCHKCTEYAKQRAIALGLVAFIAAAILSQDLSFALLSALPLCLNMLASLETLVDIFT